MLADEGIDALKVTLRTPVAFRAIGGRSRTVVSRHFTRSPGRVDLDDVDGYLRHPSVTAVGAGGCCWR